MYEHKIAPSKKMLLTDNGWLLDRVKGGYRQKVHNGNPNRYHIGRTLADMSGSENVKFVPLINSNSWSDC